MGGDIEVQLGNGRVGLFPSFDQFVIQKYEEGGRRIRIPVFTAPVTLPPNFDPTKVMTADDLEIELPDDLETHESVVECAHELIREQAEIKHSGH